MNDLNPDGRKRQARPGPPKRPSARFAMCIDRGNRRQVFGAMVDSFGPGGFRARRRSDPALARFGSSGPGLLSQILLIIASPGATGILYDYKICWSVLVLLSIILSEINYSKKLPVGGRDMAAPGAGATAVLRAGPRGPLRGVRSGAAALPIPAADPGHRPDADRGPDRAGRLSRHRRRR